MLSAVENFGSAAAATHAYAHRHNFSIAAVAAATGTAAAAAAAVMPLPQSALEHHHHMLAAHPVLTSTGGLLLPSTQLSATLPSSEGTTSTLLATSRNLSHYSSSSLNSNSSSRSQNYNKSLLSGSVAAAMSSAEFLRPHPKPLRHNGSSHSPNNPSVSPNSVGTTNGNSNGIPLHSRSSKLGGNSLGVSHLSSSRTKYSLDQSAPVNLVTSNNSSSNGGNASTPPVKTSPLESLPPPSLSPGERECEMMAGMLATQKLSFSPSEAAAMYQYTRVLAANRSLYGDSFYVPSTLQRPQLHPEHHIYSSYIHPPPSSGYSPPGAGVPLLGPPPVPTVVTTQHLSSHSASNLLSNSHNSPTGSSLSATQLPVMPPSLHLPSSQHLPQQQQSPLGLAMPYPKEKDLKSMVSQQMNGKVNMMLTAENQAGFKVPSGKEGSMKHRILTRPPYGEKDAARRRSPISAPIIRNSSNPSSPTNFTKGSLIELSTGELRRVEDMRTEDFVQSAERSAHLELADSTVVKISANSHSVTITFSYNKNRSKVDIDASPEHPFFVYGQGWASYSPEITFKAYGLKCQRLQVGDVCISLKPRESVSSSTSSLSSLSSSTSSSGSYPATPQSPITYTPNHHYKDDMGPQNLSRKTFTTSCGSSQQTITIPTTATGTTVSSRLSAHLPPPPTSNMSGHMKCGVPCYEMPHSYRTSPPVSTHNSHHIISPSQHHLHQHQLHRQKVEGHVVLAKSVGDHHHHQQQQHHSSLSSSPNSSSSMNRPPSNQQPFYLGTAPDKCNGRESSTTNGGNLDSPQLTSSDQQQAAIDASTSRKRKWSCSNPSEEGDDREDGKTPPKTMANC